MRIVIRRRLRHFWVRGFCTLALILILTIGPGWAQIDSPTWTTLTEPTTETPATATDATQSLVPQDESAKIVINNLSLLEVARTSDATAQDRADIINGRIARNWAIWIRQDDSPPQVTLDHIETSPIISVDGEELLTVTKEDALLNQADSVAALAKNWQVQIQSFLNQARQEQREGYTQKAIFSILTVFLTATALHWLLGVVWQKSLSNLLNRITFDQEELSSQGTFTVVNLFLSLTLSLVRFGVWCTAIYYSTRFFLVTRRWSTITINSLISSFTAEILSIGDTSFSVVDLVVIFGMIFLIVLLARTLTNLLRSRVLQVSGINRGVQEAIAILMRYLLIVIGVIVVLQIWGLDLSSLALLASALGIGIGLGLQNIAKDIGGGLVLVFERPIQVGDFIEFGEKMGTVERIGVRSTEVRTLDYVSIIVPNSRFLESDVINWSHGNPLSRIHIPVGVAYQSDPEAIRSILLSVGRQHPDVVAAPAPQVFFKGFGENALEFDLLVWIRVPSRQIVIKSDLYFAIAIAFHQHNIMIPFPQRDLHLIDGNLPISLNAKTEALLMQFLKLNS